MNIKLRTILGAVAAFGLISGCGGTGGGSDSSEPFGGGDSSGNISLDVNDTNISVASTSGFSVSLTDQNGQGASAGTKVTCDSELGVAIIEPNTGSEITDSNGQISGIVGCEAPGSYQFACRLPNGGGRRASVTILCSGSAPSGFTGFSGAGGGTLGGSGGSGNGNGGGSFDPALIRVTGVTFNDAGNTSGAIDTTLQVNCDGDATTNDPETFTDATVTFTIRNGSNQAVNFSSYTYTVPDVSGSADFDSTAIAFTGNNGLTINAGETGTLTAFFARASSGRKTLAGASTNVGELGFRNVTVRLAGVTDDGEEVEVTAVSGASIQDYNNCGG